MPRKKNEEMSQEDRVKKIYWERVQKPQENPETSCWLWTGATGEDKRGRIITTHQIDGKRKQRYLSAHRYAWMMNFGAIPEGMSITTTCQTKCCQNPAHLKLTTHRQTMKEMSGEGAPHRGSKHGRSVLKEEDVIRIRKLWATGLISQRNIAKLHPQVSLPLIGFIVNGIVWKHVPHFEPVTWKESLEKPSGNFRGLRKSKLRKFNDDKAREIRKRYNDGENSAALAREYKTTINTIIWIAKGKIYTDI